MSTTTITPFRHRMIEDMKALSVIRRVAGFLWSPGGSLESKWQLYTLGLSGLCGVEGCRAFP